MEDRLIHAGGTVRLVPGRHSASVILKPGFGSGGGLLLEALDTALMHGAALHGVALLHAGAFRIESAGVLVVGASFSGKSTLVAASLLAGSRLVSDDTVLLGRGASGRVLVRTACRDAYLREASCHVVPPSLRAMLVRDDPRTGGRWLLRRDAAPRRFALTCVPTVVLCVRVDRRRRQPLVRRLTAAELLSALINASSPLMVSARYAVERAALMPLLVTAAETLRGFEVHMGTDLLSEPEATVVRLLADIGMSS